MSTAETKTVMLAGVAYEVPPVSFRNAAKIHPRVEKAFATIRAREINSVLDEETYIQLGEIVYYGIAKSKDLTPDAFLDLVIPPHEMMNAAVVVAWQAGMVASPGEAEAG
jgi:hypothetical protein